MRVLDLAIDEHHFVALSGLLAANVGGGRRSLCVVLGRGAVLGRLGCRLGHGLLGNDRHGGIEHDPRLQGEQQWYLAVARSWRGLLRRLTLESLDELHAPPPAVQPPCPQAANGGKWRRPGGVATELR
ncbi:hypothetical protein D3C79_626830 [compost metagenome]